MATIGFHLLLVVVLVVGPGFFPEKPKTDDTQILDVIPATAVDAALNSGVKQARPPAAQAMIQPPPPASVPPRQPPVKPVRNPIRPEPVRHVVAPVPKPEKRVERVEPKTSQIKVDLHKVTRAALEHAHSPKTVDDSQQREARQERDRLRVIQEAARAIRENSSSSMTVEMPGSGSVSYASYASIIKSIYTRAWTPPANAANDAANAKVSITIAADGTVVSAHILTPSGDAGVDASVQRTLDRVTFIRPFPDGATEKEKTFIINFNLKAKQMLG